MGSLFVKSTLAGLAGTAVMSMVSAAAPYMGFPPMSPPQMLAAMLGLPIAFGWAMHFMIGIIFALSYAYLLGARVKVANPVVKGGIFGLAVFVFAQIAMAMMNALHGPGAAPGILLLLGSMMGHLIYGIVVASIAAPKASHG